MRAGKSHIKPRRADCRVNPAEFARSFQRGPRPVSRPPAGRREVLFHEGPGPVAGIPPIPGRKKQPSWTR